MVKIIRRKRTEKNILGEEVICFATDVQNKTIFIPDDIFTQWDKKDPDDYGDNFDSLKKESIRIDLYYFLHELGHINYAHAGVGYSKTQEIEGWNYVKSCIREEYKKEVLQLQNHCLEEK